MLRTKGIGRVRLTSSTTQTCIVRSGLLFPARPRISVRNNGHCGLKKVHTKFYRCFLLFVLWIKFFIICIQVVLNITSLRISLIRLSYSRLLVFPSYSQLLDWANLPTLKNKRLQDIAITMYIVKNDLCSQYMKDLFELNNRGYNLRVKEFMLPSFNTTSYGKHPMKYLGPQLWSKLNSNIGNTPSIDAFIKAIRKKYLEVKQL